MNTTSSEKQAKAISKRFPRTVYGSGDEPDARFSLANERTFLAWITTGLALLSAGVALHVIVPGLGHPFTKIAEVLLIVAGVACPIQAWFGWLQAEAALRHKRPLPAPMLTPWLAAALTVAGLLLLSGVVLP